MDKKMTATEFWKSKFDEEPQNDAEKLAVAMMASYKEYCQPALPLSSASEQPSAIKDEWDADMAEHKKLETHLIELVFATENQDLIDAFLKWQENRNKLNDGWLKWVESQLKNQKS